MDFQKWPSLENELLIAIGFNYWDTLQWSRLVAQINRMDSPSSGRANAGSPHDTLLSSPFSVASSCSQSMALPFEELEDPDPSKCPTPIPLPKSEPRIRNRLPNPPNPIQRQTRLCTLHGSPTATWRRAEGTPLTPTPIRTEQDRYPLTYTGLSPRSFEELTAQMKSHDTIIDNVKALLGCNLTEPNPEAEGCTVTSSLLGLLRQMNKVVQVFRTLNGTGVTGLERKSPKDLASTVTIVRNACKLVSLRLNLQEKEARSRCSSRNNEILTIDARA